MGFKPEIASYQMHPRKIPCHAERFLFFSVINTSLKENLNRVGTI